MGVGKSDRIDNMNIGVRVITLTQMLVLLFTFRFSGGTRDTLDVPSSLDCICHIAYPTVGYLEAFNAIRTALSRLYPRVRGASEERVMSSPPLVPVSTYIAMCFYNLL